MSSAKIPQSILPKIASTSFPTIIRQSQTTPKRTPLFHYAFQLHPAPLNPTTLNTTRLIASDPTHPLYIRTQRRLAAFDREKLHWTVKAPTDLSRKVTVRNWAVRRVKEAFAEELRVRGYGGDGRVREKGGAEGVVKETRPLKGALCIILDRNRAIVTAPWDEVKRECAWLAAKVERLQDAERTDSVRRQKKKP